MKHLCKQCHSELTKPLSVYTPTFDHGLTGMLCSTNCKRLWKKLSIEERRSRHYEWVREEAKTNQLNLNL